jgi:predicted N-acetyltransferase YhbS
MPNAAAILAASPITSETPADREAVERLVLDAFGPGRFAKTAERLRERAGIEAGFVVREAGAIVGSVRLWRIMIGEVEALFLGPIAVDAASRRAGLGAELVAACVDHARSIGAAGVLLVGDLPYFARFGFDAAEGVTLPGPADPKRVLWLGLGAAAPVGRAIPRP